MNLNEKPRAWLVPKLNTFKGAESVHFTRAPGNNDTDAELIEKLEGTILYNLSFFDTGVEVTDRNGVVHRCEPLYEKL